MTNLKPSAAFETHGGASTGTKKQASALSERMWGKLLPPHTPLTWMALLPDPPTFYSGLKVKAQFLQEALSDYTPTPTS